MNIQEMAQAYADAWSSGDAKDVASFFADDGTIVINRGTHTAATRRWLK